MREVVSRNFFLMIKKLRVYGDKNEPFLESKISMISGEGELLEQLSPAVAPKEARGKGI